MAIPEERVLVDGDNFKCGCYLYCLTVHYGDTSRMYLVGNPSAEARKLVASSSGMHVFWGLNRYVLLIGGWAILAIP